jgi:hypothetical protein
LIGRVRARALLAGLALVASLAGGGVAPRAVHAQGTGRFVVSGNRILDPNGSPFVIRGVVADFGVLAGGSETTYGWAAYQNRYQDMQAIRATGANLVRIFMSAWNYDATYGDPVNYPSTAVYAGETTQTAVAMLADVVNAARSQGLVVLLVDAYSDPPGGPHGTLTLNWLRYLSSYYASDPYVLFSPSNEPDCNAAASFLYDYTGDTSNCSSWTSWHAEQQQFVQAIRDGQGPAGGNQGSSSPIVVNGPSWSWDLSQIDSATYRLTDPMFPSGANIVYGAHRYANDCAHFDNTPSSEYPNGQITAVQQAWANLAATNAVYIDEVGSYDGPAPGFNAGCNGSGGATWNAITWLKDPSTGTGFIPWAMSWIQSGGGSGMVGFNWHWVDGNDMTGNQSTYPVPADETFDQWGTIFAAYL